MLLKLLQQLTLGYAVPGPETITGQWGQVPTWCLSFGVADGFVCRKLNCYSTCTEGLGNCQCVSHDPWRATFIDKIEALQLLEEVVAESTVRTEQVRSDLQWLSEKITELQAQV